MNNVVGVMHFETLAISSERAAKHCYQANFSLIKRKGKLQAGNEEPSPLLLNCCPPLYMRPSTINNYVHTSSIIILNKLLTELVVDSL